MMPYFGTLNIDKTCLFKTLIQNFIIVMFENLQLLKQIKKVKPRFFQLFLNLNLPWQSL